VTNTNCWVCGRPGAKPRRTIFGFKKPVCPKGKGCDAPRR
jgi:hypothetical protein